MNEWSESEPDLEAVLVDVSCRLREFAKPFALVGGLAVSVRAEVRFTRDVDIAVVVVRDDAELEALVRDLGGAGYRPGAVVEQEERRCACYRRLGSPSILNLVAITPLG